MEFLSVAISKTNFWIRTRGPLETISMLKKHRVVLYRYLAGDPLFVLGMKQYADGLPKLFGVELANLIRTGNVWSIRVVLTILQISRIIPGWKKIDLKSVYLPPKEDLSDVQISLKRYLVRCHILPKPNPFGWIDLHSTTRMGPNGPALSCATSDWKVWESKFFEGLQTFKRYDSLVSYIYDCKEFFPQYPSLVKPKNRDNLILRRLATIDDSEGKLRVIGILDYWSQTILKPFHTELLRMLKCLGEVDLTEGQDIKPFGDEAEPYYSIDLTSATDRFPFVLQKIVVSHLYGKKWADYWEKLMVSEPFQWKGRNYKYNTGQPMGAYSSWTSFALTHHIFIRWSASQVGLPDFTDYRVLGDDVVIRNTKVAQQYLINLTSIGVEVSPDKTLASPNTFEFAKRFFYNGVEVTPFPVSGIYNTLNDIVHSTMVLKESVRRGWPDLFIYVPNPFTDLFRTFRKFRIQGYKTWTLKYMKSLEKRGKWFWLHLGKYTDDVLIAELAYAVNDKLKALDEDQLIFQVKKFIALGVMKGQKRMIDNSSKLLSTHQAFTSGENDVYLDPDFDPSEHPESQLQDGHDWALFSDFELPVFKVLKSQSNKLLMNFSNLYSNLKTQDLDRILFINHMDLELDPNIIINTKKRVLAARSTSKNISTGINILRSQVEFNEDPIKMSDVAPDDSYRSTLK